jgi:Tol biopolymer transport system component
MTCRWLFLAVLAACHPRAELWGAGTYSGAEWDFFLAFSPKESLVLFCRADKEFEHYRILESRAGARPVVPSFAREGDNADPHFSPDGQRVVFISNRGSKTFDVWTATREGNGWSEPVRFPAPIHGVGDIWSPAIAASGNLYFGGTRPGSLGGSDLWVSRQVDGVYQAPENLGPAINGKGDEVEPWISPDESLLLFSALRRPESIGSYDIYLARREGSGWGRPRLVRGGVNTPVRDFNQSVSPDGQWLYFSSTRVLYDERVQRFGVGNGLGDLYRVPMSAL